MIRRALLLSGAAFSALTFGLFTAEGTSLAQGPQPQPYPPPQVQPQPQPYPQQQPYPPPQVQPQPQPYPQQQPYPPPQVQPQPQPYPQQQPYPQGQPQPYPQGQPQPYPQGQPQPYPPQPYPPQPYPQGQPQPYPPQGQPYPPQAQPQPYPPQQQPPPPPPAADNKRSSGELTYLYITSAAYGVGTGIWIDSLGKVTDPGLAFIAPLAFGVAMPIGVYFLDDNVTLHRGVPSSIATGMLLGALEGMSISGMQWQFTGGENGSDSQWKFHTWTTLTWIMSTGGGIGGYAFGEWLRPDPRSLSFIASGAGWGAASGIMFGAGAVGGDWKDGAAVWGFVGMNAGILATGALSTVYTPSYNAQKWMWIGYAAGTAAGLLVYPFYLASDANPRHGLIANSLGGLAGVGLAAILAGQMTDDEPSGKRAFNMPFQLGAAPAPGGGAAVTAFGTF
jgi:hypothetical protein